MSRGRNGASRSPTIRKGLIYLDISTGGEGGIRTRVGATNPLTAFEAAPL